MKKKDIYIKILEFGENRIEGFTYDEITNAIELKKLKEWEIKIIDKYLNNAWINHQRSNSRDSVTLETLFIVIEGGEVNHKDINTKYIINLDSRFKYIDYIELKEARKASRDAKILSLIAITISVLAIIMSLFITQKIKIDQQQFSKIQSLINQK